MKTDILDLFPMSEGCHVLITETPFSQKRAGFCV
jgi:hypothetical protein